MCRFLFYNSKNPHNLNPLLNDFAEMCKNSKNYQGDGWGIMYRQGDELILKRSLNPIWEDTPSINIPETDFLLVHARWAHGTWTKGDVENNQPFHKNDSLFVFNGNLKRVKIQIPGRIGAEKILNLILRESAKSDTEQGISHAVQIMKDNAQLIKAINFLLLQNNTCYIHSYYTIDPEYFDLRLWEGEGEWFITSYPIDDRVYQIIPSDQVMTRELYTDVSLLCHPRA